MPGGDPRTEGIFETLPQMTPDQHRGVLTAIHSQPRKDWKLFHSMLGLDGVAASTHINPKKAK